MFCFCGIGVKQGARRVGSLQEEASCATHHTVAHVFKVWVLFALVNIFAVATVATQLGAQRWVRRCHHPACWLSGVRTHMSDAKNMYHVF